MVNLICIEGGKMDKKDEVWLPNKEPEVVLLEESIYNMDFTLGPSSPNVLFWYDQPILFLAKWGDDKLLVSLYDDKTEERFSYFTAVTVTDQIIKDIIDDKITLYEVFQLKPNYVIEQSWDALSISRLWKDVEFPDEVLATPGYYLHRKADDK